MADMNYCPECGGPLLQHMIGGEQRNHWFCQRCQTAHHEYPRVVVTAFIACGKRLLWVQRDLPPQRGKWAIPGGFLEMGETLAEGAARDATDLFSFTDRINRHFDMPRKLRMVELMWAVAYADGVLSAHERHVLWRIADLLHVPQGAYHHARLRAQQAAGV